MADRLILQIRFKKGIFTCPDCGKEDIVDWSPAGPNEYENNCSNCGKWNNSFRDYDGCKNYVVGEIDVVEVLKGEEAKKEVAEKIIADKQLMVTTWLEQVKNPPPYIEPTKEDLQNMYSDKMNEAQNYLSKISEQATKEELEIITKEVIIEETTIEGIK
jgi:predicted RNA-binding Zn-ribbon protein involved in translation (DUF1610 family)